MVLEGFRGVRNRLVLEDFQKGFRTVLFLKKAALSTVIESKKDKTNHFINLGKARFAGETVRSV